MAFVGLEDLTGSTEVIVFPKMLESAADCWKSDAILRVKGTVSTKDNAVKILANDAKLLDTDNLDEFEEVELVEDVKSHNSNLKTTSQKSKFANENKPKPYNPKPNTQSEYPLTLPRGTKKETLVALKEVLQKYPGDATVVLLIPQNGGFERVPTKTSVKPSKDLDRAIEKLLRS